MTSTDPSNTLEIAKVLVGVMTPLSVAAIGLMISRHLKKLDLIQWKNQKLLEKRISIYDIVAPQLNLLLCFYTWVGYWKSITPAAVIQTKRDLDKTLNVYRHLFDDDVYAAYQVFTRLIFETYTLPGHDAKILSVIRGPDGDRVADGTYTWVPDWSHCFSEQGQLASKQDIRFAYQHLMARLTHSFGVDHGDA